MSCAHCPGARIESVGTLVRLLDAYMRRGWDPSLQTRNSPPEPKVLVLLGPNIPGRSVAAAAASFWVTRKSAKPMGAATIATAIAAINARCMHVLHFRLN